MALLVGALLLWPVLPGCGTIEDRKAEQSYEEGTRALDKKDYDRAIACFTGAIRHRPDWPSSYNHRAYAYFMKKDYERAIQDFTKAIELEPNDADHYHNRGQVF
jgi:tetratricopeptide (TPR) repeat protein